MPSISSHAVMPRHRLEKPKPRLGRKAKAKARAGARHSLQELLLWVLVEGRKRRVGRAVLIYCEMQFGETSPAPPWLHYERDSRLTLTLIEFLPPFKLPPICGRAHERAAPQEGVAPPPRRGSRRLFPPPGRNGAGRVRLCQWEEDERQKAELRLRAIRAS